MKPSQIGQFKAVHKKIDKLMEDMKYDISTMGELYFVRRVKSISDDLGVLIERVESGRPREPRYDDVYFEGLARLDADAKGKVEP